MSIRGTGALFLLLLSLAPTVLVAQTPETVPGGEVRVTGSVADRETGEPLVGVNVYLSSEAASEEMRRTTDTDGRFSFPGVSPGAYGVRVVRLGYESLDHRVQLPAQAEVEIDIQLSPEAVALEPVVVETARRSALARSGFFERQRRGFGNFLTRAEIEDRNPYFVSDLLRRIPGVRMSTGRGTTGELATMRGGCRPDVFLDGMRMMPPFALDDHIRVQDVEAMEVYRGPAAPAEYTATSGCGSIVIWTRSPGGDDGRPFTWKRLFATLGFFAAGLFFTR